MMEGKNRFSITPMNSPRVSAQQTLRASLEPPLCLFRLFEEESETLIFGQSDKERHFSKDRSFQAPPPSPRTGRDAGPLL